MKHSILVLLLISSNFIFCQTGKMTPLNPDIISGEENVFLYEPPEGLSVPDNSLVTFFYEGFKKNLVPLVKNENHYEFSIKVPDSIGVLILTVNNKAVKTFSDTNKDQGYVIYLKNKTQGELQNSKLQYLQLSGAANYFLQLKISPEESIKEYEHLFAENPKLKEDQAYMSYLYLKYQSDKESIRPEIIEYAKALSLKEDEKSLMSASGLYGMLKMNNESKKIDDLTIKKYPGGQLVKQKFISDFFNENDKSEKYILDSYQDYRRKFKDDSNQSGDLFYGTLIDSYLKNKDTLNLNKYSELMSDKISLANIYNNFAWGLSGQDLVSPGNDLQFAEQLSKKALKMAENKMQADQNEDLQGTYNTFADTYALILYKLGKYELAFQFEDPIAKQDELDTGGKERYAAFAEKVKGLEFTKNYLEKQLLTGEDSKVMVNQLQAIYKSLNLQEDEFENIKQRSLKLVTKKAKEKIISKYGSLKGIDFELTNLNGKKIKLSDYKGKIVVLDFWATWCGPCRASFPKMQQLVQKYAKKDVEFFFINTWERKTPETIKKEVSKYIKDNKYAFNVLFDFEDDIVEKYKIQGIPTKIVIDKNGNIISADSSDDNLVALIEENIN